MKPAILILFLAFLFSCQENNTPEPVVPVEELPQVDAIAGQWDLISAIYADDTVVFDSNRSVNLLLNDDSSYYRTTYTVVAGELVIDEEIGTYGIAKGVITFSESQAFAYKIDTGLIRQGNDYLTLSAIDIEEVFQKIYR